jgi:hypothetical protein
MILKRVQVNWQSMWLWVQYVMLQDRLLKTVHKTCQSIRQLPLYQFVAQIFQPQWMNWGKALLFCYLVVLTIAVIETARDIERDCKTGEIVVESDAGQVILNQPFQATRVDSRGAAPSAPTILKLSEDAIGNMLIMSPPRELREDNNRNRADLKGALDIDFLKEQGLVNAFDAQEKEIFQDKLSRNFLDQDFLANILDIVNAQLAAQLDLLNKNNNSKLLPDWLPLTGVTVDLQEPKVTLARDDGSNIMSVTVPTSQNPTVIMSQGWVMDIKNRVNNGGSTTITLIQK